MEPPKSVSSRAVALVFAIAFVVSTAAPAGGTPVGTQSPDEPGGPHVEAICPNPLADGDAGEYIVLAFPEQTNLTGWALNDGETTVRLANTIVEGRVAVTAEPNVTANLTDAPLLVVNELLSLANGGDEVSLLDGEEVVDEMAYEDAPDAEILA